MTPSRAGSVRGAVTVRLVALASMAPSWTVLITPPLDTPPPVAGLPHAYATTLREIKKRVSRARVSAVLAANAAMVTLYWDIGQIILERQGAEGWGAKVIDRLAFDLREAFPDMDGFSSRNLKYMRAFAVAWPNRRA